MNRPVMRPVVWAAMVFAVLVAGGRAAACASGEPEGEPGVVTGELDNGLRYVVIEREGGSGALVLRVGAGAAHEAAGKSGMAALTGRVVVASAGEGFARAFEPSRTAYGGLGFVETGYDDTTFTLAFEDGAGRVDEALRFCAGALGGRAVDVGAVGVERERVMAGLRPIEGPRLRAELKLMRALAPGSEVAARWPGGSTGELPGVSADDVVTFRDRWYGARGASVVVVTALDAGDVAARIEGVLGGVAPGGAPEAFVMRCGGAGGEAIVVVEPGLTQTTAAVLGIEALTGDGDADERRGIVAEIACEAIGGRLRERVAAGALAAYSAEARVDGSLPGVRAVTAVTRGGEGSVGGPGAGSGDRTGAGTLALEVERVARDGALAGEVEAAKRRVAARDGSDAWRAWSAVECAAQANERLERGLAARSPAAQAAHVRRVVGEVTVEEVNAYVARVLGRASRVVALVTPEEGARVDAIGGGEALGAYEAPRDIAALVGARRGAAKVVELTRHGATGVSSALLSNGVRVHHREMRERGEDQAGGGRVIFRVVFGEGEASEREEERGVSEASGAALGSPAFGGHDPGEIAGALEIAGITVSGEATATGVHLVVGAPAARAGEGAALVRAILDDPVVSERAFERWRGQRAQRVELGESDPGRVGLVELRRAWFGPGQAGGRALTAGDLSRLDRARVRAWLGSVVESAPVSVTVVGAVAWGEGVSLAAECAGGLARREDGALARVVAAGDDGDVVVRTTRPGADGGATVVWAVAGPGMDDLEGVRRMIAGMHLVDERLEAALRGERAVASHLWTSYAVDAGYEGASRLQVVALTEPGRASEALDIIERVVEEFVHDPATAAEMRAARERTLAVVDRSLGDAGVWSRRLAELDLRGGSLEEISGMRRGYASLTGEGVARAFGACLAHGRRARIEILPEGWGGEGDGDDE